LLSHLKKYGDLRLVPGKSTKKLFIFKQRSRRC
jgi:hypothetical protein